MRIVKNKIRWKRPLFKLNTEVLSEWLTQSPLNQKEFAEIIGVSESTISRWLSGDRKPKVPEQQKLCKYTNISFNNLFERL
tara:strand:- start:2006 stop:2248 length:243 start_codon:yes stop_codon:yes gene_type:complete